jgi:peptidyl-prolyl cis-trans isomerase A (cyclophilin A)
MTRHFMPVLLAAAVFLAGLAMAQAPAANPKVLLKTSKGDITIELYPDKAPITVKNFLTYAEGNFYNGLIFHRVIPGFMIQAGGMTAEMKTRSSDIPPIKNEAANGLKNDRGTVAMARTHVVDSATSQFFINLVNNANLNYKGNTPQDFGYCVFGKVVAGMDVVDAIAQVPTGSRDGHQKHQNVPVEPVTIISATVVTGK